MYRDFSTLEKLFILKRGGAEAKRIANRGWGSMQRAHLGRRRSRSKGGKDVLESGRGVVKFA